MAYRYCSLLQVYVVGGIADRTVKKNLTLKKAEKMRITCRRLPIDENIPQRRTHVLNIDTVVGVLAELAKTGDMSAALHSR